MFNNSKLAELAAKTSASRDRYVDFLRAFAIFVVVVGHWISAVIEWSSNGIKAYNAVGAISGMWVATWVLQIMPIFFFVGGFSNSITFDAFKGRSEPISKFLRTRAVRLLKPTSIFLGVWIVIVLLLSLLFKSGTQFSKGYIMVFGPLWFLAVYLGAIVCVPVMKKLHRRYHIWILVILLVLTIMVDLLHFWLKVPVVRWANVAFVWLFVHQLGFFYADGALVRVSKWVHITMALGGLIGLIILTNIGVYPKSMVGTGLEKVSNMNPPTVCIAVLTFWLVGVAMLLRDPLNRWLVHKRPWMTVIAANSIIITLYLWHLSAYAITFLIFYPFGLGHYDPGSLLWWLLRPLWIIVPTIFLVVLVGIFGRFEHLARVKKTSNPEHEYVKKEKTS